MKYKVCDPIIDGGNESNCVSQNLVGELSHREGWNPNPRQLKEEQYESISKETY